MQRQREGTPDGDRGDQACVDFHTGLIIVERGLNVTFFYDEEPVQRGRDRADRGPGPAVAHGGRRRIIAAADADMERQLLHTELAAQIAERLDAEVQQLQNAVHAAGEQRVGLFLPCRFLRRWLFLLWSSLFGWFFLLFRFLRQELQAKQPDLHRQPDTALAVGGVDAHGDAADQQQHGQDHGQRHPPRPGHSEISCCAGSWSSVCGASGFCSIGSICDGSTWRSTFSICGRSARDSRPNTRRKSGVVS